VNTKRAAHDEKAEYSQSPRRPHLRPTFFFEDREHFSFKKFAKPSKMWAYLQKKADFFEKNTFERTQKSFLYYLCSDF
jgi:hypothetical protein